VEIVLLASAGALLTLLAGIRFALLARAGAPTQLLLGWLGIIVLIPLIVFAVSRVANT
jgi:hypothetical protein